MSRPGAQHVRNEPVSQMAGGLFFWIWVIPMYRDWMSNHAVVW